MNFIKVRKKPLEVEAFQSQTSFLADTQHPNIKIKVKPSDWIVLDEVNLLFLKLEFFERDYEKLKTEKTVDSICERD